VQISKLNVDLVIFDCDGVLVDSEVISCRAHAETLTRHGYPITSDEVLDRFLGVSDHEARLIVEAELGRCLPGILKRRSGRPRSSATRTIWQ
jgi:beta-phosphoglucomutase-like phosphatase (HAD superfamily)